MEVLVVCAVASSPASNLQCDFCINQERTGEENYISPGNCANYLQLRKAAEESCNYNITTYRVKNNNLTPCSRQTCLKYLFNTSIITGLNLTKPAGFK